MFTTSTTTRTGTCSRRMWSTTTGGEIGEFGIVFAGGYLEILLPRLENGLEEL
jgi:hypothetical protein